LSLLYPRVGQLGDCDIQTRGSGRGIPDPMVSHCDTQRTREQGVIYHFGRNHEKNPQSLHNQNVKGQKKKPGGVASPSKKKKGVLCVHEVRELKELEMRWSTKRKQEKRKRKT